MVKPQSMAVLIGALLATPTAGAREVAAAQPARGEQPRFSVVEAGIADMQKAMKDGRVTSRELVLQYLTRIATYEDKLNAAMTVNPRALQEAEALDRERARGKLRGPLHGIPIALKDNIHTTDMPTTGGALAFDGLVPPYEATLVKNLRDAGAIIIAKTVMTELANWVTTAPTLMPPNYMNPYDPRRDPRETNFDGRPVLPPGGSSSGIGTAANLWAANVGTETSGSLLSPGNQNMLATIKPTVGRISRYGILPLTADQDTAGPMGRTVADVAILMGVLEGAAPDPHDPATKACTPPPHRDYTRYLKRDALDGARIGIPRAFYYDAIVAPGESAPRGGLTPEQRAVMAGAIAILRRLGAVIVDPADIPSVVEKDASKNFLRWDTCRGYQNAKGKDAGCSVVAKYGFKRDFNLWLASLGRAAPLKTLTDLRNWNLAHKNAGSMKYGQSLLDISDEMDLEADRVRYETDRAKDIAIYGTNGIDAIMKSERLDAILFPAATGAAISAKPGYPTVIVPFGMVPNTAGSPFPEGFNPQPAPFGVSFAGMACSEPRLIGLAYAFEHATRRRVPPPSAP